VDIIRQIKIWRKDETVFLTFIIALFFIGCGEESAATQSYHNATSVQLSDSNIQQLRLSSIDANNVAGTTTFRVDHSFTYTFKIENLESEVSGTWAYNQENNVLTYTVPLLGDSITSFNGSSVFVGDQLVIISDESSTTLASGEITKLELLK